MKKIFIETEFIKLDQLLKFAEIVDSGGLAKIIIAEGYVKVNGSFCTQRGKKIVYDDLVEVTLPVENGEPEVHKLKILRGENLDN